MVRTRSSTADVIPSLPRRLSSSSPLSSIGFSPSNDSRPPITRNQRRYSFGGSSEDLAFDSPVTTYQSVQRNIPTYKNDQRTDLRRRREGEKRKQKGRGIPLPPKKKSSIPKRDTRAAHDKTIPCTRESSLENSSQSHHDSKEFDNNGKRLLSGCQKPSFLSGINVHSQNIDFLSLPDPPTPSVNCKNLRRKRRLSSPIIRSTPLKDVTNEENNIERKMQLHPAKKSRSRVLDEGEKCSENHTGLVQKRDPTRSCHKNRRSLCHVASPSLNENESSTKRYTVNSENILSNKKETTGSKNSTDDIFTQEGAIVLESDDEDEYTSRRSKGRRSMIIPKRFQCATNDKTESFMSERNQRKVNELNITTENTINVENGKIFKSACFKNKRRNRKSILLPSEQTSDGLLNHLTNHSLPAEDPDKGNFPLSKSTEEITSLTHGNKNHLKELVRQFSRLSPKERILSDQSIKIETLTGYSLVTPMERMNKKKEYEKDSDLKTYDSSSRKSITSDSRNDDFFMKKCREEKQKLIMKMGPLVEMMEKRKKEETSLIRKETLCRVQKKKGEMQYFCVKSGDKIPKEEYQRRYLKMIEKNRLANMLLRSKVKAQNLSSLLENKIGGKSDSCIITNETESLKENEAIASTSPNNTDFNPNIENTLLTDIQEVDPYDLLPSKDEPSLDPEVAAAEQRLWSAIDIAMEAFTHEMFALSAARKAITSKISGQIAERKRRRTQL